MVALVEQDFAAEAGPTSRGQPLEFRLVYGATFAVVLPFAVLAALLPGGGRRRPFATARDAAWSAALATVPQATFW